jgi:hypothetical protein
MIGRLERPEDWAAWDRLLTEAGAREQEIIARVELLAHQRPEASPAELIAATRAFLHASAALEQPVAPRADAVPSTVGATPRPANRPWLIGGVSAVVAAAAMALVVLNLPDDDGQRLRGGEGVVDHGAVEVTGARVLEAQVGAWAGVVQARPGRDGTVGLAWLPPAGSDRAAWAWWVGDDGQVRGLDGGPPARLTRRAVLTEDHGVVVVAVVDEALSDLGDLVQVIGTGAEPAPLGGARFLLVDPEWATPGGPP